MTDYPLDNRLETSSHHVMTIAGCDLRLVDDARILWCLLIPMKAGISELFDLEITAYDEMMRAANHIAKVISENTKSDKMNIAAIGNMVPQCHLHIIARRKTDFAWPDPVWGKGAALAYQPEALATQIAALQNWLAQNWLAQN